MTQTHLGKKFDDYIKTISVTLLTQDHTFLNLKNPIILFLFDLFF